MLHTISWGKCHFFMSGHLCLTIYKMGDLWKVTRFINKIRTWHSILRSSLQILKNAFECPNVVRYLKWWLFHQLWKCEWLHAFFFAYQPSVIVPGKIVNLLSGHEIYKSQRKMLKKSFKLDVNIFIGPESDHWKCLSVTHWLTDSPTDCHLVNMTDVTLAYEDAYSKLVQVATIASDLLSRFWSWISGEILKLKFDEYFGEVWLRLLSWILVNILKLGLDKILTLDLVEMLMFG